MMNNTEKKVDVYDIAESLKALANRQIRQGEVIPPFALVLDSSQHNLVPVSEEECRGGVSLPALIKTLAAKMGADYVLLLSESWSLEGKGKNNFDEYRDIECYPSLSDHPDAIEGVFLTLDSRENGSRLWVARIESAGGVRILGDFEEKVGAVLSGRCASFFEKSEKEVN